MSKLYLLVILVAGACGFSPSGRFESDATRGSASGSDAGVTAAGCHASDPSIRLCLDFEDNPLGSTIADLANHHDGSASRVAPVQRSGQQAGGFAYDPISGYGSEIAIAETPDLDIADDLTYELYLLVSGVPQDDVWPIDNYQEYGLKFTNDNLTCYAGGAYATSIAPVAAGWHHVACTYGDGKLRIYVDGLNVGCHTTYGTIHDNGDGMTLGAELTGALDDIHIYARRFDSDEIAARAGVNPGNEVVCKTN